jgi:hypothetical protein
MSLGLNSVELSQKYSDGGNPRAIEAEEAYGLGI